MNDDACIAWGYRVLQSIGAHGWTIEWEPCGKGRNEGITLFSVKKIGILWESGKPDYALLAHEIAHVLAGAEHSHDSTFAHAFLRIIREFFIPWKSNSTLKTGVTEEVLT